MIQTSKLSLTVNGAAVPDAFVGELRTADLNGDLAQQLDEAGYLFCVMCMIRSKSMLHDERFCTDWQRSARSATQSKAVWRLVYPGDERSIRPQKIWGHFDGQSAKARPCDR